MSKRKRLSSEEDAQQKLHLSYVKAISFGRFSDTTFGPFGPQFNVVYGPNESGKTTINELVKSTLFGWTRAKTGVNTYQPPSADRVGSLLFSDKSSSLVEVKRERDGSLSPQGYEVISDMDKATFETMFQLTSDELMGLEHHDEVTTRLLTAGSGAVASPATALSHLDNEIKLVFSKSSKVPDSLPNIRIAKSKLMESLRQDENQADQFRNQEQQLAALAPRKETLAGLQRDLNVEIGELKSARVKLESLEEKLEETQVSLNQAHINERSLASFSDGDQDEETLHLRNLSSKDDRRIRDSLDEFEEALTKLSHLHDNAKRDAAKSQAEFEVLHEDRDMETEKERARRQRFIKLALSISLALVMLLCGLYGLFGVENKSLTILALSVFVIAIALGILFAGITINLRPSRVEERYRDSLKKAEWVMQQDRKNVEASQREVDDQLTKAKTFLASNNLSAANGSIRLARHLLDDAREARAEREFALQNQQAIKLQISALESEIDHIENQRMSVLASINLPAYAAIEDVSARIEERELERSKTIDLASETNHRYGELTQLLNQARNLDSFDQRKLELSHLEQREKETKRRLATLLVAKDMMERAVSRWEQQSQPEVYRRASILFERMTNGRWRKVFMTEDGSIEVVDQNYESRQPYLLSVGTRQQLYLSLRIALLMTADQVGRDLPILCDDILVNFDHARRKRAAEALLELSHYRQVIFFTCHRETARLFAGLEPAVNFIEL